MLALGPRLLSRALGILPLLPAVPSLGHDAPYGHGDPPEPGNTAPRGLGSSEVSMGIPMDCGPRSQLVTTALGAGGMQERGMQDMHGRSGLGSLMPAGLQVVTTTKQLWWWGWTQISQDFLASGASPVEADGRRVWVWGANTAFIVVISRGAPSLGVPHVRDAVGAAGNVPMGGESTELAG